VADAISLSSDFKVYEPEFNAGFHEQIYLNSNIFNGASRGAIQLITQVHPGHYYKEAYFKQVASLVTRQDITSTSAVDSKKLEQVEEIGVKLHRKVGPVQSTLKAWAMAGLETPEGSMMLGRQVGDAVSKQMASDAIISVVAAVGGQAALIKDVTGESTKTATISYLNDTRLKWGDQLTKLAVWLQHSKVFGDLVADGLAIELESVAGALVARGGVAALMGGGMVISDNTNLVNSGTPDTYNVIGLASGAALVKQSELQKIVIKMITGLEQLVVEIQGEYANTVSIEGFAWDVTNGGSNPNDTALATTTNWDKVRTDTTGLPLVKLLCQ
jgi:hypothetical protein